MHKTLHITRPYTHTRRSSGALVVPRFGFELRPMILTTRIMTKRSRKTHICKWKLKFVQLNVYKGFSQKCQTYSSGSSPMSLPQLYTRIQWQLCIFCVALLPSIVCFHQSSRKHPVKIQKIQLYTVPYSSSDLIMTRNY